LSAARQPRGRSRAQQPGDAGDRVSPRQIAQLCFPQRGEEPDARSQASFDRNEGKVHAMKPDIKAESKEVLQEVCNLLASEELGIAVSFMGEKGEIVASSRRGRIGQFHEIAARIMAGELDECEVTAEMAAKSSVMLPGWNIAIDVMDFGFGL
jgi:hypothetical protein